MNIDKLIIDIQNKTVDEKIIEFRKCSNVYYNLCKNITDNELNANTLFFTSISTILGIDLNVDEPEYLFFQKVFENEISFESFYELVKGSTRRKIIEDTNDLIDNLSTKKEKEAFIKMCIILALSNDELHQNELNLIKKYFE